MQFACDTLTAKDLESDNMHKLQSAQQSDSNTRSHRRARPINAKKSSECSPLYNPTTYFVGSPPPLPCADVWIINHISYQTPIPYHKRSFPKVCQGAEQLAIQKEVPAKEFKLFIVFAEPPQRHFCAFWMPLAKIIISKSKVWRLLRQFNQCHLKPSSQNSRSACRTGTWDMKGQLQRLVYIIS